MYICLRRRRYWLNMTMIYFGYEGMLAAAAAAGQQLHYMMTTKDNIVNGGGSGGAALQQEEGSDMGMEEKEEAALQLQLPYLDEGIVTNILVKVHSAESLYNSLRYVCKPWNNIISHHPDIHLNFLLPSSKATSCIIIIQNMDNSSHTYLNSTPEPEIVEASKNRTFTTCILKMGTRERDVGLEQHVDLTPTFKRLRIRTCCNGLVLATPEGPFDCHTLCIVNPLTNHIVVLPPSPSKMLAWPPVRFTFLPSIGKYKVVTIGRDRDEPTHHFIEVLTMSSPPSAAVGNCSSGGDAAEPCPHWRQIEAPERLTDEPLEINGIYYWPQSFHGAGYIVSFDVASERFYTTPHKLYLSIKEDRRYNGFMDFGGYLAFWSFRPADGAGEVETNRRTFSVHVMEDLHKRRGGGGGGGGGGGEWKELFSGVRLDMDFIIKAGLVKPWLSVGSGEVMIFKNIHLSGEGSGGNRGVTLWAYHFKSRTWLKVGNNLKELDYLNFSGYLVKNNTPMPLDSLSPL